jgi:hypothetical protein
MAESYKYDEVKEVLLAALREGMPKSHACDLAGLSRRTFYDWLDRAEDGQVEYAQIAHDIKKAQADFVQARLAEIKKASSGGQWQASAWMLERMFKEDFARLEKVAPTNPDGTEQYSHKIQSELDKLDTKTLEKLANGTQKNSKRTSKENRTS